MNPIEPTIGRVVYVGSRHSLTPVAAIVTAVIDNETLKVTAFLADSAPTPMTVFYSTSGADSTWQWMPFQLAQAGAVPPDPTPEGTGLESSDDTSSSEPVTTDPTQPVEGAAPAGESESNEVVA